MGQLKNKTALITGGSRGIGKAIVEKFVEEGCQVAFTYLGSVDKAEKICKELSTDTCKVRSYKCDASSLAETENLIKTVLEDFGDIDILINNAGITKDGLIMRMSEEQWNQVIQTNLNSVFNTTKALQRHFLKSKKGSIINMGSVIGIHGNAGQSNYAASKAAIIGFSKSVALELGSRNIRCNVIAPGFIETEMTASLGEDVIEKYTQQIPLKRMGTGEDVANLCVFLGSDASKYITAQVIAVDGAMFT